MIQSHNRFPADTSDAQDDDFRNDFLTNVTRINASQVSFGHGSVAHGRDSIYWDRDDRRRDEDYNEDAVYKSNTSRVDNIGKGNFPDKGKIASKTSEKNNIRATNHHGLYNEAGRDELKMYEEKYEASLKHIGQSGSKIMDESHIPDGHNLATNNEEIHIDDEYDDGIDIRDARVDDYDNGRYKNEVHSGLPKTHSNDGGDNSKAHYIPKILVEESSEYSSSELHISDNIDWKHRQDGVANTQSKSSYEKQSKKHGRRHKFSCKFSQQLVFSKLQLMCGDNIFMS